MRKPAAIILTSIKTDFFSEFLQRLILKANKNKDCLFNVVYLRNNVFPARAGLRLTVILSGVERYLIHFLQNSKLAKRYLRYLLKNQPLKARILLMYNL